MGTTFIRTPLFMVLLTTTIRAGDDLIALFQPILYLDVVDILNICLHLDLFDRIPRHDDKGHFIQVTAG